MQRFAAITTLIIISGLVLGVLSEGIGNETFTNDNSQITNRIWRRFDIETYPLVPGTLSIRGVRIERTGVGNFKRDVALFGATINRQTTFGLSYYDSEGSIGSDILGSRGSFSFSSSRVAAALRLLYIIEYTEDNGVPGYQPGADTQLSNVSLTPALSSGQDVYNAIVRSNQTFVDGTTNTNYTVHMLDLTSKDGAFAARLYASTKPIFVDGRPLTPDRIKLTFAFDYWNPNNLVATTNPNARLALVSVYAAAGVQSYRNRTVSSDTDGIDNDGADSTVRGGYNWELHTSVVDRTNNSTSRNGSIHTQFYRGANTTGAFGSFGTAVNGAFEGSWHLGLLIHDLDVTYGEKLYWDPNADIEIDYDAQTPTSVPSTASSLSTCFAIFVLIAIAMMF